MASSEQAEQPSQPSSTPGSENVAPREPLDLTPFGCIRAASWNVAWGCPCFRVVALPTCSLPRKRAGRREKQRLPQQ
ncbi:uncharacterized protein [Physeter macrocephalus]|uniref:Uncharacterized protein isoform X2 n=1 Tax=Physeter macrocephalus TaxID=9755 RepID=A0A455AXM6_PHYMC|nr:uncharacterized protein LOC114485055 isoform X2 [Physeter catodon]|eukprot:XP_028341297.1 uncharacterized protein LOC114485055 isoform X2 [Physeter catodon]